MIDSNGAVVNSSAATLTITASFPTLFGLSDSVFYGSILGVVVVVVAVVLLVVRGRRRAQAEAERRARVAASPPVAGYRLDDPRLENARGRTPPPP